MVDGLIWLVKVVMPILYIYTHNSNNDTTTTHINKSIRIPEGGENTHPGPPSPESPPPPARRPLAPAPCGTSVVGVVFLRDPSDLCIVCLVRIFGRWEVAWWWSGGGGRSVDVDCIPKPNLEQRHDLSFVKSKARIDHLEHELLQELAVVDAGDVGLQLVVLVAVFFCGGMRCLGCG